MSQPPLKNQLFAEFIGTAALFCAVIGSGIMAVNLSDGNNGVALQFVPEGRPLPALRQ